MKKKVVHSHETTLLDKETGEILTISRDSVSIVESEPPFIKLYIDAISSIEGLNDSGKNTMLELIKLVDYDGRVILNAGIKRIISKTLGIKTHSIDNNLTTLIKSGFISRVDTGIYLLSPFYFSKGAWKDVQKKRIDFIKISMVFFGDEQTMEITTSMKEGDTPTS